ncbi:MAG: hypothetical protein Q8Q20_05920 [bacterium]|nr:hypothetical protein [bacterium]
MNPLRRFLFVVALLLPLNAMAQTDGTLYQFRYQAAGGKADRFVGNQPVGDIRQGSLRLDVFDNHIHRFALEYENFDNRVPGSFGLELPEERFSIAIDHPVGPGWDLVAAGNMYSYNTDESYWAYGLYPSHLWDSRVTVPGFEQRDGTPTYRSHRIAFGFERDIENATLGYGYLRWYPSPTAFFAGFSREEFTGHGFPLPRFVYERLGGGAIIPFPGQLKALAGATYNLDEAEVTWTAGLARIAELRSDGMNPAFFLAVRQKPEAFYSLGIVTLWGNTLNEMAVPGIYEAFYRGSLNQSRVVSNRDFNTVGVGQAYDAQDFGRLVLTGTSLKIQAGSTDLEVEEVVVYYTLPTALGALARPYLGLRFLHENDLIFDPGSFQLINPDQESWTLLFGTKLWLTERPDPRHRQQNGYLRLEAGLVFHEGFSGVTAETTFWF